MLRVSLHNERPVLLNKNTAVGERHERWGGKVGNVAVGRNQERHDS